MDLDMYRYIFFDLDGTLTDSKEGIFNSLRYAFEKMGVEAPDESTLIKFIGPPLQDSFARYCGFTEKQAIEGIRLFRERYAPVGKFENAAAPGMAELCRRLKERGYVLALASSKPEEMCISICERFGFAPYLAVISGNILLPLLYHSFKTASIYLWTRYCRETSCRNLYEIKLNLYRALLNRDEAAAIALTPGEFPRTID